MAKTIIVINENDFLGSLQLAVRSSPIISMPGHPTATYANYTQFVVGLGQHPPDARGLGHRTDAAHGNQSREATQTNNEKDSSDDQLQHFLQEAHRNPTGSLSEDARGVAQFLAAQVAQCLKTLLIFSDVAELDLERGLAELGVDSLIAMELQSWWVQNLASHVTILELTQSASVLALGELARARMLEGIMNGDADAVSQGI
jgi:aryl carrier-like protein